MTVDFGTAAESYIFDKLKKSKFEYGEHPFNSLSQQEQDKVVVQCRKRGISVDDWCTLKRNGWT